MKKQTEQDDFPFWKVLGIMTFLGLGAAMGMLSFFYYAIPQDRIIEGRVREELAKQTIDCRKQVSDFLSSNTSPK